MSTALPLRFPDPVSPALMTRRAWWLVVLNVLIPGSAQVVAGNRRLGRVGLVATLVLWAVVLVTLLGFAVARATLIELAANDATLWIVLVALVFYAALWVVLTLDTLRLVRLVKLHPNARAFVSGVAIAAMVVTAGTAAYGAYLSNTTIGLLDSIFSGGHKIAAPVDGRYNILVLGGDAGPDREGMRTDSISVVSIDAKSGAATMIGIPRNMQRVPFVKGSPMYSIYPNGYACGVNCLIDYLYPVGQAHASLYPDAVKNGSQPGIEAVRDAVEGVLGITVQYYVLIDMQGFADLIDALGGITIDVKERYPIGGFEAPDGQPTQVVGWIEPGVQRMNGFTAEWYARSRHGTSDYDRMARQREIEQAILKEFQPATVLSKFQAIAKAGKQIVKTDIPSGGLGVLADLAEKSRSQPVQTLELVPPTINEIHPDFAEIQQLVKAALVLKKPAN